MPLTETVTVLAPPPPAAPARTRITAVLTGGCDGYPAGTIGEVLGEREGCVDFAPFEPGEVARWAVRREHLLVPRSLLVAAD